MQFTYPLFFLLIAVLAFFIDITIATTDTAVAVVVGISHNDDIGKNTNRPSSSQLIYSLPSTEQVPKNSKSTSSTITTNTNTATTTTTTVASTTNTITTSKNSSKGIRTSNSKRRLPGEDYEFNNGDLKSAEIGFIAGFLFLIILIILLICCCCCACCGSRNGNNYNNGGGYYGNNNYGGGGYGGGGSSCCGCNLWDIVALVCIWEMCCDDNRNCDDGNAFDAMC